MNHSKLIEESQTISQNHSTSNFNGLTIPEKHQSFNHIDDFHNELLQKPGIFSHVSYKYFNAAILIISALCNSMVVVSLATINHEVTQYFDVSTSMVSFCALQFMIINPIVSIFANYILDNKGLKLGISINCVLVIFGVSLRMLIHQSFYFVIIGNAFNAMGNIFMVNCPARFSSVWFKPQQRIIVTSLIGFSNSVSGQIGAIMSPYFVPDNLSPQQGQSRVQSLINFQAILISSAMLLNLIFFRGIPGKRSKQTFQQKIQSLLESQPSIQDEKKQNLLPEHQHKNSQSSHRKSRYINQLKQMFTTINYILILIAFMGVCSVLNCFATNIQLYIIPFGFDSTDAGMLTLVSVGTGLAGALISGFIIKKIQKFKIVIIVQLALSVLASLFMILSLQIANRPMLYISVGLFTMLLYPLFPAMIEYGCQYMHPIRQSTIAGILVGVGQLFSFGMGMVQTYMLSEKSKQNVLICLGLNLGCYLVALIAIVFSKQELKRLLKSKSAQKL